jgi:hypothetical protein
MNPGGALVFQHRCLTTAPPPIDVESAIHDELDLGLVQGFCDEWNRDHRHMGSEWKNLRDARTEYYDDRIDLTLFSSDDEFENSFNSKPDGDEGKSIMQYFNFLRFIILSNFVMTIWCFIGWIPHMQNARPLMDKEGLGELTDSTSAVDLLFLSSYQPSSDQYWLTMMVLGTIWMTFSGFLYMLVDRMFFSEEEYSTANDQTANEKKTSDIIHPDNPPVASHRIVTTYLVLALLCLIPIGINYGLLYELNRKNLKVFLFTSCECPRFSALPLVSASLLPVSTTPAGDHSNRPAFAPTLRCSQSLYENVAGPYDPDGKKSELTMKNIATSAVTVSVVTTVRFGRVDCDRGSILDLHARQFEYCIVPIDIDLSSRPTMPE